MNRKLDVVDEYTQRLGSPIATKTLAVILNPDTHTADIHLIDGFHLRTGWDSPEATAGYVGSVKYA